MTEEKLSEFEAGRKYALLISNLYQQFGELRLKVKYSPPSSYKEEFSVCVKETYLIVLKNINKIYKEAVKLANKHNYEKGKLELEKIDRELGELEEIIKAATKRESLQKLFSSHFLI